MISKKQSGRKTLRCCECNGRFYEVWSVTPEFVMVGFDFCNDCIEQLEYDIHHFRD